MCRHLSCVWQQCFASEYETRIKSIQSERSRLRGAIKVWTQEKATSGKKSVKIGCENAFKILLRFRIQTRCATTFGNNCQVFMLGLGSSPLDCVSWMPLKQKQGKFFNQTQQAMEMKWLNRDDVQVITTGKGDHAIHDCSNILPLIGWELGASFSLFFWGGGGGLVRQPYSSTDYFFSLSLLTSSATDT